MENQQYQVFDEEKQEKENIKDDKIHDLIGDAPPKKKKRIVKSLGKTLFIIQNTIQTLSRPIGVSLENIMFQ